MEDVEALNQSFPNYTFSEMEIKTMAERCFHSEDQSLINSTLCKDLFEYLKNMTPPPPITIVDPMEQLVAMRIFFYSVYILIFVLGICGNALVCYVVIRNKNMHTVTNLFITNLALSDILLCIFAVPFTPLYLLIYKAWNFGTLLCHLVPFAQGVSVYISAFTLMSIAIDRFFVIIYPFKPRMKISICGLIIVSIWLAAALLTLPYGIFMDLIPDSGISYCDEAWPYEVSRKAFGFTTSVLQFVVPFIIITYCYVRVCGKLCDRAKARPGSVSHRREEMERERTRRTNSMLISMVVIFVISWLPLNGYNLIEDFYIPMSSWQYSRPFFVLAHAVAMSSTCYNPFLYAWLNENFRKEFKMVLPCFRANCGSVATVDQDDKTKATVNTNANKKCCPENGGTNKCNGSDKLNNLHVQVDGQKPTLDKNAVDSTVVNIQVNDVAVDENSESVPMMGKNDKEDDVVREEPL